MSTLDNRITRLEQQTTDQGRCYCVQIGSTDLAGRTTTDHPSEACVHGRPWWLSVQLVEVPRAHGQGTHA